MLAQGFNFILSLINSESDPTKVIEVKIDDYVKRDVLYRDEALLMYAPNFLSQSKKPQYEIIFNTLQKVFSLFRSESKEETENKFSCFQEKLVVFMDITKEKDLLNSLQKLCDLLTENPQWTLAHIVAHFNLDTLLEHRDVAKHLNSVESATGMSPLQVAISARATAAVKALVNKKCALEHLDYKGNTVYHYAASSTKEIITILTTGSKQSLNVTNQNGHTPLHLSCIAQKPECVKALLLAGANVNVEALFHDNLNSTANIPPGYVGDFLAENPNALSAEDMTSGGTPLHWALTKVIIEDLCNCKCNINALDFKKRSALHIMVMKNKLDCVVTLLSRDANPDIGDFEGNRPIHCAIEIGNASIVQSLITFGANLDVLNNEGHTARHLIKDKTNVKILYYLHAVGASRCPEDKIGCTEGCKFSGTFIGEAPPPIMGSTNRDIINQMLAVGAMNLAASRNKPRTGRLLCLDGGGIRGLVLIQMLIELERIIGKSVNSCFDLIAGTSTGGILALSIACGKTMKEALCTYMQMKDTTFIGMRPYYTEPLEKVLKDTFGEHTLMTDIKHPKLMVTGVLADRKPVELHLFRNYQSPNDILNIKHDSPYELPAPPEETLLWHVGRATGAAPTYFRSFGIYLDGGLISNNPTLDAITEIQERNLALAAVGRESDIWEIKCIVSLGTGRIPSSKQQINVNRPDSIFDSARLVMGISTLGTLLVDQATQSDGQVVNRARAWCSSIGVPYYRFNPQLSVDVAMDENSDELLINMLWETKAYMHENLTTMREVADLLLN